MKASDAPLPKAAALRLLRAAAQVSRKAHAPYSEFQVGSALLTTTGEVITGCNVENASYGLTICAERNAIFQAVARGQRKYSAIAIVASGPQMPFPCGACRQVLAEFGAPGMKVLVAPRAKLNTYKELTLGELLPHSFRF
ncbi:MAG TPA: cytidine deaminase [Kiritimatiellia bacterium]|nr:cytidine deaminase [Kiritimatiellia bacterium]